MNNIQGIPQTIWIKFFEALGNNSTVELLTATNCDLTDTVGSAVASCLERNKSLKYLTLDSNNISGDMLVKIIRSTAQSKVLEELRCSNQVSIRGESVRPPSTHLCGTRGLKKTKNGEFVCFLVRPPSVRFLRTVPFSPEAQVQRNGV